MSCNTHPVAIARLARGLSQHELALQTGLTQVAISRIERGHIKRPHLTTRRLIAAALGFEAEDLFAPAGAELAQAIADVSGDVVGRRRAARRPRLSRADVEELARLRGWSLEPSDEFGGYSEAEYEAAYLRADSASWRPMTIEGVREQPPRWFVEAALRRSGPSLRAPGRSRPRTGARRRAPQQTRRKTGSSDDGGESHHQPGAGR